MTRVLLGGLSALHRAGIEAILRAGGFELVEAAAADVMTRLVEVLPDVIVLDLNQRDTPGLVALIVHRFPTVKVLACSAEQPMMRVYPPLHYGESYLTELDPALLTSAIQT